MRPATWCVVALLIVPQAVPAQEQRQPDSDTLQASPSPPDTGMIRTAPAELPRLPGVTGDTILIAGRPAKSPTLALVLSALLPGAGQVYNESYWKVPIILGFGVYFASQWLDQNRRYVEARDKFTESLKTNPNGDALQLARREFYKNQRDSFTWYFLILYVLNLADAYVDASLYDFDVGGTLSVRMLPGDGPRVGVRVRF